MSIWKHNYHSHSTYSDGNSSIKEMIQSAEKSGLESFGITDHSPVPVPSDWNMQPDQIENYLREIQQEAEKSSIDILAGIEIDYLQGEQPLSSEFLKKLDFTVGSLHYLKVDENFIEIDSSANGFKELLNQHFGGKIERLSKHYATQQLEMMQMYHPTILGHIDLLSKYNEKSPLFDESDETWLKPLVDVLKLASEMGIIVEINTGAISRGHRSVPYPSPLLLKKAAEFGLRMTLNGDSHSTGGITTAYDQAIAIAKECGIKELWRLHKGGSASAISIV